MFWNWEAKLSEWSFIFHHSTNGDVFSLSDQTQTSSPCTNSTKRSHLNLCTLVRTPQYICALVCKAILWPLFWTKKTFRGGIAIGRTFWFMIISISFHFTKMIDFQLEIKFLNFSSCELWNIGVATMCHKSAHANFSKRPI